jgi:hypothetical protein
MTRDGPQASAIPKARKIANLKGSSTTWSHAQRYSDKKTICILEEAKAGAPYVLWTISSRSEMLSETTTSAYEIISNQTEYMLNKPSLYLERYRKTFFLFFYCITFDFHLTLKGKGKAIRCMQIKSWTYVLVSIHSPLLIYSWFKRGICCATTHNHASTPGLRVGWDGT